MGRRLWAGGVCIRGGGGGEIGPAEVAARLAEAAETLRRLPDDRPGGYKSCMPTPLREARDMWDNALKAGRWEDMTVSLGPPAADAITRMDEAMGWLAWLGPDEAKLVWGRACGVPWKVLVSKFHRARNTLWRNWIASLVVISLKLNE